MGQGIYFPPSPAVAGSNKTIQFNDGGIQSGDTNLTWDKTTQQILVRGTGDSGIPVLELHATSTAHGYPECFTVICDDNGSDPSFRFKRQTAGNGNFVFMISGSSTGSALFINETSQIRGQIAIYPSGNVGIGTGLNTQNSKFSIVGLPTSAAGLNAGDIWVDTTGGLNILKIV